LPELPSREKFKLTKRAIDALRPAAKRVVYWDSDVSGFGLRIMPGGLRVYVLQYRFQGRLRWFRIGRHGSPWTPDQARNEAVRLLGEIARGIDPAAGRDDGRKSVTFGELVDLYFAEGVAHKKPRTLKTDKGRARLHLVPLLGRKRADAVTRADVQHLLNSVIDGRALRKPEKRGPGSIPTGGRGVGAQCVALASSIFEFGVKRGVRADNPARGIKKPPVRKMERFLSFAELAALADSLDEELSASNAVHAVAAIRLLALTGCRRGEIAGLKWADVDFDRRLLHLRDSKDAREASLFEPGRG